MWPTLGDLILSGTIISLQPTTEPGALAEVIFDNRSVNGPHDEGDYTLTMEGLSAGVHFDWDADGGDDRITVTPPDGVICIPGCDLTLPEGTVGKMILIDWSGM